MRICQLVTVEKTVSLLKGIERNIDEIEILLYIARRELNTVSFDEIVDFSIECMNETKYTYYIQKDSLKYYLFERHLYNEWYLESLLAEL